MSEPVFSYRTVIPTKEEVLYKEKGSKFWGFIVRVESKEEVDNLLEEIKNKHPQARHHSYAYTYGVEEPKNYRINDDGEPSNSAGIPIYNQLLSYELDNTMIVVVRYFGGTKLGISGLIHAYKTTAERCIEASKIIEVERQFEAKISCEYNQLSSVYHYLNTHENKIIDQKLEMKCEIWVAFPLRNKEEILTYFNEQPFEFQLVSK